jgi:outer membrane protein TolC
MKYFIVSLLGFWGYAFYFPVNASAQTLDVETFIQMVVKYHPVVKRTNLDISISESELLQSRGAFDPQLKSSFSRKDMGGITYYNYQQTELKIPTWYGIEISGGIESVNGSSTDPQETKGESSYIGISLPVLQNLLLDKRRAALQKARIMVDYSKNEQLAVINDILLEALLQYWEWVRLDQELNMLLSVKQNIEQRLNFTNTTIAIGERAPIDSLEAQAQLLFIEGLENELQVAVRNAKIALSAYTWTENGQAVNLPQDLKPAEGLLQIDNIRFEAETQQFFEQEAMRNHPELQAYPIKLQYL